MTPPGRRRRGIHGLLSVAMLTGFSLTGASLLFVALSDHADIATSSARCGISDVLLHGTGPDRAYFAVTIHNLGSVPVGSVNATFADPDGDRHGFTGQKIRIPPGGAWSDSGSFQASVGDSGIRTVYASAAFEDGSVAHCIM